MRRSFGLILLAAAITTGCATSTVTGTAVTKTSTGASTRPATAAGQGTRKQAEAAAAGLLGAFVPPPGAHRLTGPPNLPGGLEQHPQSVMVSNSMVDVPAFWEAPGEPDSLLSWEQARLTGKRFKLGDADFGPPSWDREFDLPATKLLTDRELIVEVVGEGNGKTAIRLDADIAWQPSRPSYDVVPGTARVVTIRELPSVMPHAKRPPAPVTITDPAVVARLAALVNGLPVSPLDNEVVSCPAAGLEGSLQLAFRTRAGGPVEALVQTDQPCDMTGLTVTGHRRLGLDNANVDRRILAIASLHWKLRQL